MNKTRIFIISSVLTVFFSTLAHSYDNANIKDAKTCNNLLNSILSANDGGSIYKMSPVFDSNSGDVFNVPNAGRYDYVEIIPEQLKSKPFRESLIKTEGRLFYKSKNSIFDAQKFFATWIEKPKAIFAIPYNKKSIKHVYGDKLDNKAINDISSQMNRINNSLEGIDVAQPSNGDVKINRKYIYDELSNDETDTIILVGHNSEGALMLPSGEKLNISELQIAAKKKGKNMLIITCNSFDYVDASFEGLVSIERLNYESIVEGIELAEKNKCKYTDCTMFMGDYIYFLDQGIANNIAPLNKIKAKIVITVSTVDNGSIATVSFIVTYNNEA